MRYMFLIYTKEAERAQHSAEEMNKAMAEPLQPTSTATTVRVQNGKVMITDGPFAETKEQLGGYYILDCKDLDEALEWAGKIPTACGGGNGCVEVRPIGDLPARTEGSQGAEFAKSVNG